MKAGVSDEEIAARLSMDVAKVHEAIQNFESYRAELSHDLVDTVVNMEAAVALEGVGDDLRDARQGLRFTGAYDTTGEPIFERDLTTMLASVSVLGSLVAKIRPRGGGLQINTAIQNNSNGGNGSGPGQGRSFEAMLREAKAQRALTAGDGPAVALADEIADAEFEDEPDTDTDEDIPGGIALDDPDDAGIDEEQDNGE